MNISSSLKLNSKFNIRSDENGLVLDLDILKIKLKKNYIYKLKSNIESNDIELFERSLKDIVVKKNLNESLPRQIKFRKKINEDTILFNFKAFLFFMFKYVKDDSFAEDVMNEFNSKNINLIIQSFNYYEHSEDPMIDINSNNPIIKIFNNYVIAPKNNEIIIQYILKNIIGKLSEGLLPPEFLIKKLYIFYPKNLFKK